MARIAVGSAGTRSDDMTSVVGERVLHSVAGPEATALANRSALAMFTPACVAAGRLSHGTDFLRDAGFTIVSAHRVILAESDVDLIWRPQSAGFTAERWRVARRLFCAGPAVVVVCGSEDPTWSSAAHHLKSLQGPSSPALLEAGDLRAALGAVNKINNLVHIPDDPRMTIRELSVMLGERLAAEAWRAVQVGRPLADIERTITALAGGDRSDALCFARTASRLRWRAFLAAEALMSDSSDMDFRESLATELDWALSVPWLGWRAIRQWRELFGPASAGRRFAAWLGADAELAKAMVALDSLLADEALDVALIDDTFDAAGLALSTWELVALTTQGVAQEIERHDE